MRSMLVAIAILFLLFFFLGGCGGAPFTFVDEGTPAEDAAPPADATPDQRLTLRDGANVPDAADAPDAPSVTSDAGAQPDGQPAQVDASAPDTAPTCTPVPQGTTWTCDIAPFPAIQIRPPYLCLRLSNGTQEYSLPATCLQCLERVTCACLLAGRPNTFTNCTDVGHHVIAELL
jgi:hypothetical protein